MEKSRLRRLREVPRGCLEIEPFSPSHRPPTISHRSSRLGLTFWSWWPVSKDKGFSENRSFHTASVAEIRIAARCPRCGVEVVQSKPQPAAREQQSWVFSKVKHNNALDRLDETKLELENASAKCLKARGPVFVGYRSFMILLSVATAQASRRCEWLKAGDARGR